MKILIAGIGNIFLGDDGFGVEVAQRLARLAWPHGVQVCDFGICGIDLAYALSEGIDAAILIDTVHRDGPAGSLYVLEPQLESARETPDAPAFSPHDMDPEHVLRWVAQYGGSAHRIAIVGCEPESFGTENDADGCMGLSAPVASAVPQAMQLVEELVEQMMRTHEGVSHVA